MSDSTQEARATSSDTPEMQDLSVSSTGQQRILHLLGPDAPGVNWDELLQFESNHAGLLWSRTNFNTLVVTLEQPFTVPRTDLRANELQIEIHSEDSADPEDNVNHFETKTEGVAIHFFENSPLVDTASSSTSGLRTSTGSVGNRMRFTTRHNCSVIGPIEYVMSLRRPPGDGGDGFELQLSIPSASTDRGSPEYTTVDAKFDSGLEAITIGPNFEGEGAIIFGRLRQSPLRDPPHHRMTLADGTELTLGAISDGQAIFYCPSADPVDWNAMLMSNIDAIGRLATMQSLGLDDSDPGSDSDFDFAAGTFMD